MIFSNFLVFNVICLYPQRTQHFGSIAGTQVGNVLMAVTWEGPFSVQVWKGHNFWSENKNGLKILKVLYG